ncbi:SdrD B-like domain-containing protein [Actinosynnema pretiosum]|nr:SdrD B-like domain-containing protein [Actinosynnema pretiosum]
MRATRKHLAAALVCSAIAPLLLTGVATAQDGIPVGEGSASGMIWNDANGNGRIDSGEQGVEGQGVTLLYYDPAVSEPGIPVTTTTAADGTYRFENLPMAMYELRLNAQEGRIFTGWGPDSRFSIYGQTGSPFFLDAEHPNAEGFKGGVADSAANDYRAYDVLLDPVKETYQVGDVVRIVGGAHVDGPFWDYYTATLTVPEGLEKLTAQGEAIGGMRLASETPTQLRGVLDEKQYPGDYTYLGAHYRVTKPISAGQITFEVEPGSFRQLDPDASNNTTAKPFTAVAAPVAPTADPAVDPIAQPVGEVVTPAPTSSSAATGASAAVPVAQDHESLASTGASPVGLIALAGALLTAGVAAFGLSRRRRAKA